MIIDEPKPMIPFNIPFLSGDESVYVNQAIKSKDLSGDNHFSSTCSQFLTQFTQAQRVLMTTSCTHALEMCAILCNIQAGDEVIMPSFNFVSAANAFVLRGAQIVFVDIKPDTMNMDEEQIEAAITPNTKAILVMHYGGVACAMDEIVRIAKTNNLFIIEDAAHCIGAYYNSQHLGTIGHLGVLSFHSTKNLHCGEGGALLINTPELIERAEIIKDKGTNRQNFLLGKVDRYTWVDLGSSYSMSELNAAFLLAQLENIKAVNQARQNLWNLYYQKISEASLPIQKPTIKPNQDHNAHIFFIRTHESVKRNALIAYLKAKGIDSRFHYIPMHSSIAGRRYGRISQSCEQTLTESDRLIRLPLFKDLEDTQIDFIVNELIAFYGNQ